MTKLSRTYHSGSQTRSKSPVIRKCGCGVVALADLLLYLVDRRPVDYDRFCRRLQRWYLPTLPPFGIVGLSLVHAFNRICRRNSLPYRARWNTSRRTLWPRMEEMLTNEIPVILAIGPNLRNKKLPLHGAITKTAVKGHYVTVTAMDAQTLTVRSWGREYRISRKEFEAYAKTTGYVTSNILYISPK